MGNDLWNQCRKLVSFYKGNLNDMNKLLIWKNEKFMISMKLRGIICCWIHLIKCWSFSVVGFSSTSYTSSMSSTSSEMSVTILKTFWIKSRPIVWSTSVSPPGSGNPVTSNTGSLFYSVFSTTFWTLSWSDYPPKSATCSILWSTSLSPPSIATCKIYSAR